MPNENFDEPPESEEYCGEEIESVPGTYCSNKAKFSDGKCGLHSDDYDKHSEGGHWTHGAHSKRSTYYKKLSNYEKSWVETVYESFIEEAPFSEERQGKCELVWNVAIDMHKQRRINDYIDSEGMVQEKVVGSSESGPVFDEEENVLHLTYDRLSRSNLKTLKELGILGNSPDSKAADAQETFVDIFRGISVDD